MRRKILMVLIYFICIFALSNKVYADIDHSLNYDIEEFYMSGDNLVISGWAFIHNYDNIGGSNFSLSFFFENSSGKRIGNSYGYVLDDFKVTFNSRNLTTVMCYKSGGHCIGNNYKYENVGFSISIPLDKYLDDFSDDVWYLKIDAKHSVGGEKIENLAVYDSVPQIDTFGSNQFELSGIGKYIEVIGNHVTYETGNLYWRLTGGSTDYYEVSSRTFSSGNNVSTYYLYNSGSSITRAYGLSTCGFDETYFSGVYLNQCRCVIPGKNVISPIKSTFVKPTGTVKLRYKEKKEEPVTNKCGIDRGSDVCDSSSENFSCLQTVIGTATYRKSHSMVVDSKEYVLSGNVIDGSVNVSNTNTCGGGCSSYKKDENGIETTDCDEYYPTYDCWTVTYDTEEETKIYQDLSINENVGLLFSGDMNGTFKKGTGFGFGLNYTYDISWAETGDMRGCYSSITTWMTTCKEAIETAEDDFVANLKKKVNDAISSVKSSVLDGNYTVANPDPVFSSAGEWKCEGPKVSENSISASCDYSLKEAFIKYDTGLIAYGKSGNSNYISGGNLYYIPMKFPYDDFTWNVSSSSITALNTYRIGARCLVHTKTGLYDPSGNYVFNYRSIDENDPFPKGVVPTNWEVNYENNIKRIANSFNYLHYQTNVLNSSSISDMITLYDSKPYTSWNNVSKGGQSSLISDSRYFNIVGTRSKIHCDIGEFDASCDSR